MSPNKVDLNLKRKEIQVGHVNVYRQHVSVGQIDQYRNDDCIEE
jgi:hypothetical protein